MKILVVDRDDMSAQLMRGKLSGLGHEMVYEANKSNAVDRVAADAFDVIFIDPSPLTNARQTILNMRRAAANYPYVVLMSENASPEEALKSGANDLFPKPFDPVNLTRCLSGAAKVIELVERIGDGNEDFPSAGGVIAKSAFNQLFLSALDRGDRYGENTFIIFITLSNYVDIKKLDGVYAADHAAALLSRNLVRLRRQSDIIGQTGRNEYALLLQRPQYVTEPADAANRFAQNLSQLTDMGESGVKEVEITVSLVAIPSGMKSVEHVIRLLPQRA